MLTHISILDGVAHERAHAIVVATFACRDPSEYTQNDAEIAEDSIAEAQTKKRQHSHILEQDK